MKQIKKNLHDIDKYKTTNKKHKKTMIRKTRSKHDVNKSKIKIQNTIRN